MLPRVQATLDAIPCNPLVAGQLRYDVLASDNALEELLTPLFGMEHPLIFRVKVLRLEQVGVRVGVGNETFAKGQLCGIKKIIHLTSVGESRPKLGLSEDLHCRGFCLWGDAKTLLF